MATHFAPPNVPETTPTAPEAVQIGHKTPTAEFIFDSSRPKV